MADVTVLLAEDHTIVRKGLRSLLDGQPGIRVVGEAEDGREALAQVERLKPDIVLMDISMPLLNGIEATRQIRALRAGTRVIVLTVHSHEEYVLQALHAGARGYLPKSAAPDELVAAIRAVSQGEPFLSQSLPCTAAAECLRKAAPDPYERVTPREREVLQLIAEGHRNREIAELLHISVKTVETHRAHLLRNSASAPPPNSPSTPSARGSSPRRRDPDRPHKIRVSPMAPERGVRYIGGILRRQPSTLSHRPVPPPPPCRAACIHDGAQRRAPYGREAPASHRSQHLLAEPAHVAVTGVVGNGAHSACGACAGR